MLKTLLFSVAFMAVGIGTAEAQAPGGREVAPQNHPTNGGAGIRSGNITATGATVPNPGVSQGAGTTSLDRGIQEDDTRIQGSICRGC